LYFSFPASNPHSFFPISQSNFQQELIAQQEFKVKS
jgi:hypothetical protein